uniref:Peptidase S1 domain-containing protein n=1 Tax=Clastoptera arizonana TaxID=38151 RepID=A0A1B6D173_9HEMI
MHYVYTTLLLNYINFHVSNAKIYNEEEGLRPVYSMHAKLGEAPFVVLVDSIYKKCTGTIISHLWVMTTASCVQDADYKIRENISVIAGILDYENKENFTTKQEHNVVETIVYPLYKDLTYVNALTLLKISMGKCTLSFL